MLLYISNVIPGFIIKARKCGEKVKDPKYDQLYSSNNVPCWQGERRVVWTVMTKDWDKCDAPVKCRAKADPRQHQLENSEIDIP
jgi:hypothetical protein